MPEFIGNFVWKCNECGKTHFMEADAAKCEESHEQVETMRDQFLAEASEAFDCVLEQDEGTRMRMIDSDHGYAVWLIAPLSVKVGNEMATLIVEDAGETQRRFILTVLDEEPFMLVHSYFKPSDTQTFEISSHGKIPK
jgi:hypothetical protein